MLTLPRQPKGCHQPMKEVFSTVCKQARTLSLDFTRYAMSIGAEESTNTMPN